MNKSFTRLAAAAVAAALSLAAMTLDHTSRIALSLLVGLPSFVLMIISRRQLGKAFSIMPQATALVTTGLYSRIQHPMYVFLDLFLLSLVIALGVPILLLVWGILVVVQTLQSRREERVLAAAFGAQYDAYRDRTWL